VFCGECGNIYRRIHWNNRGKKSIVWRCVGRLEDKDLNCNAPTIVEEDLQRSVLQAINQVITDGSEFIEILEMNIIAGLGIVFDKDVSEVESQLEDLQEQIVTVANRKEDYDTVVEEIFRLREERQAIQEYNANRQGKRQRIAEMTTFLKEQTGKLTEYDDKLVRQLVERVEVLEDKLQIEFKSGLKTEVEL